MSTTKKKKKKFINSLENCEFCLIFVEIIACIWEGGNLACAKRKILIPRITNEKSQSWPILGKIIAYLRSKNSQFK